MNPTQFQNKLDKAFPKIQEALNKIELRAAQKSLEKLIYRIDTGEDTRDVKRDRLKPYTKGYARFRQKKGLQTNVKDLRLTGQMMDSIDVGTKDGKEVMGFTNQLASNKAEWQEKQNKTIIFALSENEKAELMVEVKEDLFDELRNLWR